MLSVYLSLVYIIFIVVLYCSYQDNVGQTKPLVMYRMPDVIC